MPSTTLRRKLATALVVLCAVLLGMDGGRVICFGADGHVGIESLDQGHRLERSTPSPAATSLGEAPIEHGPCVDASLWPNPAVKTASDDPGPTTPTPPALHAISAEDVARLGQVAAAWSLASRWRPASGNLPAVGLAITVLRI